MIIRLVAPAPVVNGGSGHSDSDAEPRLHGAGIIFSDCRASHGMSSDSRSRETSPACLPQP